MSSWSQYINDAIAKGISAEEIQRKLDVSPAVLARWRSGTAEPPLQTQNVLKQILGRIWRGGE